MSIFAWISTTWFKEYQESRKNRRIFVPLIINLKNMFDCHIRSRLFFSSKMRVRTVYKGTDTRWETTQDLFFLGGWKRKIITIQRALHFLKSLTWYCIDLFTCFVDLESRRWDLLPWERTLAPLPGPLCIDKLQHRWWRCCQILPPGALGVPQIQSWLKIYDP